MNPTSDNNLDLLNIFIRVYNQTNNKNNNMFSNINEKDPTSTNVMMELFYEYMKEYNELFKLDPQFVDVYDRETINEITNNNKNIYAIEIDEKINILSMSYMSLLVYAQFELKEFDNWNIIKLQK